MEYLQAGYGLDQNGYILSDVAADKISADYDACIKESVHQLSKLFPKKLHSVYVYGSVARGDAAYGTSDLDLLALFHGTLQKVDKEEVKGLSQKLSETYHYLVRDVGVAMADYDYVIHPMNYYEQAFLKELCVCVHGEDLRGRFGPYKLSPEVAISFNGDIGEVLDRTMKRLSSAAEKDFKILTQNFARKLIRTCYSMVMARSQIWTTRLREQSEVFIQYFPDKEPTIRTLLKWIEEPPANREHIYQFFVSEGKWLTDNFNQEARITACP
ncbi:nucleotidyltransferase domain-containing protein [Virgibacillus sp. YIM 98842]|uniref:nucleotidyltransferase domain-containing protein n=1 Tax=Virgibacillus sp. YIM 98842 TaxID=2663533 RepID=UPI0013DBBA5C|nr:nucleotidyltransferase domain-containing protein [Virgibacillus sp. YIM 98842]